MKLVQSSLGCTSWILLGAIAGWLASVITGCNNCQGHLTNVVDGVVDALSATQPSASSPAAPLSSASG